MRSPARTPSATSALMMPFLASLTPHRTPIYRHTHRHGTCTCVHALLSGGADSLAQKCGVVARTLANINTTTNSTVTTVLTSSIITISPPASVEPPVV